MSHLFHRDFRVDGSDADCFGYCRASVLHKALVETASEHAEAAGFGRQAVFDQTGSFWILTRLSLHMSLPLRYDQAYTVLTWPRGIGGPFAYRDFEIMAGDRLAGEGTSAWVIANLQGGILRPGDLPGLREFTCPERPPKDLLKKLCAPELQPAGHREIRYSDLDLNRHMNNVRYLDIACDLLALHNGPPSYLRHHQINYEAQCLPHEVLELYRGRHPDGRIHIAGRAEGRNRFRIELTVETQE